MRTVWGSLAAVFAIAGLMQLTNCVFEAAGSVPDLEGCGFLAGGLLSHAILYPLLAGIIGYHWARRFSTESVDSDSPLAGWVGALGASLYLGGGMALAFLRNQQDIWSIPAVSWCALYVVLCFAGARIGASIARNSGRTFAWPDG